MGGEKRKLEGGWRLERTWGWRARAWEQRRRPRSPHAPPDPCPPAAGGFAPAWTRRAFPGSELRSCPSAGLGVGPSPGAPPGGPDCPSVRTSLGSGPTPSLGISSEPEDVSVGSESLRNLEIMTSPEEALAAFSAGTGGRIELIRFYILPDTYRMFPLYL